MIDYVNHDGSRGVSMNALMKVDQIEGGPYDPGLGSVGERRSFYDRRLGNTRGREGDVQSYQDQLGGGRTFSSSSVAMSPLDITRRLGNTHGREGDVQFCRDQLGGG